MSKTILFGLLIGLIIIGAYSYLLNSKYVESSKIWKTYELSYITFQAPENFTVEMNDSNLINNGMAHIKPFKRTEKRGPGGVLIDSISFKGLQSYEDALKYYKFNKDIKVSRIKEFGNGHEITGQRY